MRTYSMVIFIFLFSTIYAQKNCVIEKEPEQILNGFMLKYVPQNHYNPKDCYFEFNVPVESDVKVFVKKI